jgi:hypothetical protein
MFSFFRKKTTDSSAVASTPARSKPFLQTIVSNTGYAINSTLKVIIGGSMITAVNGEKCFEKDDHDYSLYSRDEDSLYDLLVKLNGVYNDGKNDCAHYFTSTMNFGKSAFGAYTCQLSSHIVNPDSGIVKTLEDNCPSGFGASWVDYFAVAGIVAGGALVVGCCCVAMCRNAGGASYQPARLSAERDVEAQIEGQGEIRASAPPVEGEVTLDASPHALISADLGQVLGGAPGGAIIAGNTPPISAVNFISQRTVKQEGEKQRVAADASLATSHNKTPLLRASSY